jgi:transcription initiation factor TFIIIB Brf1 subunit/transcription initiation factor TFIIB
VVTFKEISAVSGIEVKEIGRCQKRILRALETSVNIISIKDFMPRFCLSLGKDCSKVTMRKKN